MKVRIKHRIDKNQIKITALMRLKKYKSDKTEKFGYDQLIEYCERNNVPIGSLVSCSRDECTNDRVSSCSGEWVFSISKEHKKSLTKKNKNGIIKETTKTKTHRARASAIAKRRTAAAKKAQQKQEERDNTENADIKRSPEQSE